MVIDDTQEILDLFRLILEDANYEVALYSYALQDMAEVRKVMPDAIILDFLFGGENMGLQFIQKVRMTPDLAHIPIIACTAAINAIREQEGFLNQQNVRVVLKPFDIESLLNAVDVMLTRGTAPEAAVENKHNGHT